MQADEPPPPAKGSLTLPSFAGDALKSLDLNDPSDFSQADQDEFIGAAVTGGLGIFILFGFLDIGFVADFVVSLLFGTVPLAYASLRKDDIGTTTRGTVGKYSVMAVDKVAALDKEYKVTETVKTKVKDLTGL